MEPASERAEPKFTVLLPIHRGPHLLPYAVESVLRQRETSFELFIICDGAPEATAEYARRCESRDSRVRAFVFPKGERHGEAYRDRALSEARGRFVAQIADDDLWLDDHLLELEKLLETVDFGNLLPVTVRGDQSLITGSIDIADPQTRSGLMSRCTIGMGGPTVVGYRLDTYRRLPEGWSPAPPNIPADLHMWRKFLALPGTRFGTRAAVTVLAFVSTQRRGWSDDRRKQEMAGWAERIKDPAECDSIKQQALLVMCRQARAFYMLGPMRLRRFAWMMVADRRRLMADFSWLRTALRSRFRQP